MTTYQYVEVFPMFIKFCEIDGKPEDYNAWDITERDILFFLEYIRENESPAQYFAKQAEKVVSVLKRYYTARSYNLRELAEYKEKLHDSGVSYLADIKRNREIVKLYLKDQTRPLKDRKWSYRKLADEFGITFGRVQQIIKRDTPKYAREYGLTGPRDY